MATAEQLAGQTQQNTNTQSAATDANKFPMSDGADIFSQTVDDDWGILFDEASGRLELSSRRPADIPSQQQAIQEKEGEGESSNNLNQSSVQPANNELAELKQNFEKLASIVVGMVQGQQQIPQQQQAHQEEELDFNQPGALQKLIKDTVTQALTPYLRDIEDLRVRSQYSTLAVTHGEAFKNAIPRIAVLMESDPNLSFESAFQAIQKLDALNGKNGNHKTAQDSTTHQPQQVAQPKVNVQQVAQKANQLSTDSQNGVGSDTNGKSTPVKNLNDALDRALNTVLGGRQ